MEHEEKDRDILSGHCQAFKRDYDRDEEYKKGLIPKGRRTKRYKPSSSPIPQLNELCYQPNDSPSMVLSSLSPTFDSFSAPSSPSSRESLCEHTEEEQEVASYLLLLSNCHDSPYHVSPINEAPPIQFVEAKSKSSSSKIIGPDGRTYYRCEDCGREFLSFQALGGHRASHKKSRSAQPKNINYDSKTNMLDIIKEDAEAKKQDEDLLKLSMNSFSMSMVKARIHQCTICDCEFTSGQALGGHMRRHRNPAMTSEATFSDIVTPDMDNEENEEDETLKENQTSPLIFDLNLPAPLEEKRASNPLFSSEPDFQF